jgi:YgiT-type zinc finger domain-containing protein
MVANMWSSEIDERWRELAEEALTGMKEWRLAHPKATLSEIEAALDERLEAVRARMLQDAAQVSAAADIAKGEDAPHCPECGGKLRDRGRETRQVTTKGDQTIVLRRSYGLCPGCGARLFPPGRGAGAASR